MNYRYNETQSLFLIYYMKKIFKRLNKPYSKVRAFHINIFQIAKKNRITSVLTKRTPNEQRFLYTVMKNNFYLLTKHISQ